MQRVGDETRLALIARLSVGQPGSIMHLTEGSHLTRQAITKHLRVLEVAGIVRSVRSGRKNLFEFEPAPQFDVKCYIDVVAQQWVQSLLRLKARAER